LKRVKIVTKTEAQVSADHNCLVGAWKTTGSKLIEQWKSEAKHCFT